MCHANVVGVDDQEFCVVVVAEFFGKSFASVLGVRIEKGASKAEEKQV